MEREILKNVWPAPDLQVSIPSEQNVVCVNVSSLLVQQAAAGLDGISAHRAHDLNPVPTDLMARVLTTNIDLEEGTCSIDLIEAASGYFGLSLAAARAIIKEVAVVTATWREPARQAGARTAEINRMASAFEHDDLKQALAL